MASATEQSVTLLLMGRAGNGKSSTGNSILRKREFKTSASKESTTYEISKASSTIKDQEVIVVDGPGIRDAQADKLEEEAKSLLNAMNDTFSKYCSSKFSALLIVLKYGIRYTRQEKDTVMMIKSVFGSDVLNKYGVIVMTHGDSFDLDMEDEDGMSFEEWCKGQGGDVKALFDECGYRCVLFDNKSKDEKKLTSQRNTLMSVVAGIRNGNYTNTEFQVAEGGRKKLYVESKLPRLEEETKKIVDKINSSLDQISGAGSFESSTAEEELKVLTAELDRHEKHLDDEDDHTQSVERVMMDVKLIQMRIKTVSRMFELQKQGAEPAEMENEIRSEMEKIEGDNKKANELWFRSFIETLLAYWNSFWSWLQSDWAQTSVNQESNGEEVDFEGTCVMVDKTEIERDPPVRGKKDRISELMPSALDEAGDQGVPNQTAMPS